MGGKTGRRLLTSAALSLSLLFLTAALVLCGCGEGPSQDEKAPEVLETAAAFLNACGNLDEGEVRSFLSRDYLESNQVPDPITRDELIAALGYMNSYRLVPAEDITVEEDEAVVAVTMDITGKGEREETMILRLKDGEWRVDAFTAMDWSSGPAPQEGENAEVEQALGEFLIACVDCNTGYIFEHLSEDYREKHHLEKAWTSAEFSGIFGTARSYDFDPNEIDIENGAAGVDVTIEFGSRGNLESETSRVFLVKDGQDWLVDSFPFFIN